MTASGRVAGAQHQAVRVRGAFEERLRAGQFLVLRRAGRLRHEFLLSPAPRLPTAVAGQSPGT
jgi:hypothetical protein